MSQPEQGLDVQLMRALTSDPQPATEGRKGVRPLSLQTVAGDDDGLQSSRQACEQLAQRLRDRGAGYDLIQVWSCLGRMEGSSPRGGAAVPGLPLAREHARWRAPRRWKGGDPRRESYRCNARHKAIRPTWSAVA